MGIVVHIYEDFMKMEEYRTNLDIALEPVRSLVKNTTSRLERDKELKLFNNYYFKITVTGTRKGRTYFDQKNLDLNLNTNKTLFNVLFMEEEVKPIIRVTLTISDPIHDAKQPLMMKYGNMFELSSMKDILSFVTTFDEIKINTTKNPEKVGWLDKAKMDRAPKRFGID